MYFTHREGKTRKVFQAWNMDSSTTNLFESNQSAGKHIEGKPSTLILRSWLHNLAASYTGYERSECCEYIEDTGCCIAT
jgi:hypothetical protein